MHKRMSILFPLGLLCCPCVMPAQSKAISLPDAPGFVAQLQTVPAPAPVPAPPPPASSPAPVPAPQPSVSAPAPSGPTLTRQQAEQLALKNNPRISVAGLLALAQKQVVRETRAAEFPTLNGEVTGVGAEEASRISTGSLSASRLLNHAGAGVEFDQLITDFGRTRNLVASSSYRQKSTEQQAQATREDVVLAADLAFYRTLEAQATLRVAQSTVSARQTVNEQVGALTASKLKSTLDQSFAQVNLSQAQLLNLGAQNQYDSQSAALNEILGTTDDTQYNLVDDPNPPVPIAGSAEAVISLALQQRPDLLALKLTHDADVRFARAQRDQILPTVSGLGIVGATPWAPNTSTNVYFLENWYGAAGVNISIPIFNGFKFHAEASEADLRAKASDEESRGLVDRIVRDVRTAWLTMNTAQQRMGVTAELLKEANTALDLADTRYRLGLSSIVELSQAQLQQTQAQIDDANARFEYEADLAALKFQSGSQP
jgi:outer membrane protein